MKLILAVWLLLLAAATGSDETFWTTRDVAEYLGVPESSVRYWSYMQRGPRSYKLGRHRRYRPSEVKAWADAQAEEPVAPTPPGRRSR